MANIQFNYLYRDGGNYKKYGSVVFANPGGVTVGELTILIKSQLIDQTWFYHNQWRLPDLRGQTFDNTIDPTWHEFENVTYTNEPATRQKTLAYFMDIIG